MDFVEKNVVKGSEVNTDEYRAYVKLSKMSYIHRIIEHSKKIYASQGVSTNSIEGFWSQLKRSINGTHHFVSPKCLQNYVNEFSFRYNLRKSQTPIFFNMINRIYVTL